MANPKLSIVIPAYNEEKRITSSLRSVNEFVKTLNYNYEIIVSDDGSTDKTVEIVESFIKEWPKLRILKNKHKGKAPTLLAGFKACKGDYVLFTDTDLSVSITEAPKLLTWVFEHDYDISIATREGVGAERIGEPYTRHLMGRVFNTIVQVLLLKGINDTQCGFKAFKNSTLQKIISKMVLFSVKSDEIEHAKVSAFDVEVLFVAKKLGVNIKEVPVKWTYGSSSKVHNIKDSYYNLKDVLQIWWNDKLSKYSSK